MDIQKIQSYIEEYKNNFSFISKKEIYKWQATKQFQDNWDINSFDFKGMLENSLKLVKNLMDSGQYFPKRMLLNNTRKSPELIRELFKYLFDEELDLKERIVFFQEEFEYINKQNFGKLKTYQDSRAIIVYLCLRYPERYFFYKFEMFKEFTERIDYPYKPVKGKIDNIGHFLNLCDLLRHQIQHDQELLKLHKKRIDQKCYFDENSNILTQDFIYAVTTHLQNIVSRKKVAEISQNVDHVNSRNIAIESDNFNFNGSVVNFQQNEAENKRLGDLGELWVIEYEMQKLTEKKRKKYSSRIIHVSKTSGDGTGFDIQSIDMNGNPIFIEVKTTRGPRNTAFYISRTELERSKIEKDKYFLYRLYNFNEETKKSDLLIIKGDLNNLCTEPSNYKVKLATP